MLIDDITTERLRLRQWKESDFPALATFFASPENTRFVGGVKSSEEAWRVMATYIGHFQLYGYSYMAVVDQATDQLQGAVGLWNSPDWPEPELGYWFLPQGQGKGYAFEAASALKQLAVGSTEIGTLVSYIAQENKPSIKLAEKLGAQVDGAIELFSFGTHQVYRHK